MQHPGVSPYARALADLPLHPQLRTYFSTIPEGHIGVGEGVFERFGVRHRWMMPFLMPLHRRGVLAAVQAQDVPFRVVNRTIADRAMARRTLSLPDGEWVMHDAVALTPGGRLVDEIGSPGMVVARFAADADTGALVLRSTAVGLRLGRLRIRIPDLFAPVVHLRESHEASSGRQRVEFTLHLPLIGVVYEYRGTFTYRIEKERA